MDVSEIVRFAFFISLLSSVLRLISGAGEVSTTGAVSVTEGETARITCSFNDSNLVAMEWRIGSDILLRVFKGRTFIVDNRFNMTSDYTLVVKDSRQNDTNTYTCQISTTGIFSAATNLTVSPVISTPRPPTTAPPTLLTSTASTSTSTDPITQERRSTADATPNPQSVKPDLTPKVAAVEVKPTTEKDTASTITPTNKAPSHLTSGSTNIIIIAASVAGGLILLALFCLVAYCCCCKEDSAPNGYKPPIEEVPIPTRV